MLVVLFELLIYASLSAESMEHFRKTGKLSNAIAKKRMLAQCPPEPIESKENIVISPKTDSTFINKAVYGCHQAFLSKGFRFTNCILRFYACNFTNSNSDANAIYFNSNAISTQLKGDIEISGCRFSKYHSQFGGSIYIFSADLSRTVSISNCYFNSSSTIQSEKGGALFINAASVIIKNTQFINCHSVNGGCLYYSNENNNQAANTKFTLKVKRCIFKNNKANSNGGSLYLTTQNSKLDSFIEVKGCKFTNNFAENGCDISYLFGTERSTEGEKLIITDNVFSRNSKLNIKGNMQESLIFASFNPYSKIEFTKNQVSVDESFNRVFLFDYPEGTTLSKGQLKVADNDVQPSFENQIDRKKIISSQFEFHGSHLLEEATECQKPSGFTDNDFYACNQRFTEPIIKNSQLRVDHCNFTNINNNAAIKIEGYTGSTDGSISIEGCNFVFCRNGAIDINNNNNNNNANPKELTIKKCNFILCTSGSKGSAISITSASGTIDQCKFYYNEAYNMVGTLSVIYYENPSSNGKLTIQGCFFEYSIDVDNIPLSFMHFHSGSIFDFNNNIMKLYCNKAYIFSCSDETADIRSYSISGNTLYPYDSNYIGSGITVPDNAFDEPPLSECPGLPGGVENTGQNEQCGTISESSTDTVVTSNTIVSIYYSSFKNSKYNGGSGGAVYISLPANSQIDPTIPIQIYYSSFYKCFAKYGSAIYLKSSQPSRLFDIHQCAFTYMNQDSNNNPDVYGACVYIQSSASSFSFTNCLFDSNKAHDGAGIYYTTGESAESSTLLENEKTKFAFSVKDSVFTNNKVTSCGGAIYIQIDVEPLKPIEIDSCMFFGNAVPDEIKDPEKKRGGAIYYSFNAQLSAESSYSFKVINSVFESNHVYNRGGAICISIATIEQYNTIEIAKCSFADNHAHFQNSDLIDGYGGDVCYILDNVLNSQSSSTNPSLYIHDCTSFSSSGYLEGGSISIVINNSISSRSIEIEQCLFKTTNTYDSLLLTKKGNFISYTVNSSDYNPPLNINNCDFLYKFSVEIDFVPITENGGSIYLSVTNSQQTGCIEIKNCNFTSNFDTSANFVGGSIYYYHESTSSSSETPNSVLKITDCKFTESYSKLNGGSIYMQVKSNANKQVEINRCSFDQSGSKNENTNSNDSIYIESDSKTAKFDIIDCTFASNSIFFDALSGSIDKCHFSDIKKGEHAVKYLRDSPPDPTSDATLSIKNCDFKQDTEDAVSLIYFDKVLKSKFSFTDNTIAFKNDQSHVLDCNEAIDIYEIKSDYWYFKSNKIEPQTYDIIKTDVAEDIPADCGDQFTCKIDEPPKEEPPSEECSPNQEGTEFYACKMIIKSPVTPKGQLILDHCNFTNFKESIAVNVSEYTDSNKIININVCNFVHCKEGAISLNNVDTKELTISHCYFISCSVKADINFKSKKGLIQYCKFLYNPSSEKADGVIHYENPSTTESDDMLAIRQCFFEYNDPSGNSVFLAFKSGSKFELTYNAFKIYYYNENDDVQTGTRILKCIGGSESTTTDIRKYPIKGNTLYPFEKELIGNNIKYPFRGFTRPRDSECPGLPDGVDNTGENELCSNIAEASDDRVVQSHTIVSIYYSSFTSNGNKDSLGGAVYVHISDGLDVDRKIPIEIYYSAFVKCKAKFGCGIYLESTQASRLFDIHRCSFISNNDSPESTQGAGIYIKSSLSTFKISRCFFKDNKALEGGGIYFTNHDSTSSENKDIEFTLNVKDCVFISNTVNDNGGGLCIKITNAESLKPIEINSCIFLANNNNNKDGGAIYYSFDHKSTGGTSYTFRVYNSVFEENAVTQYGGSIYVTVLNKDIYNPIEIDNCSFSTNKAQHGGCICYNYLSATTTMRSSLLEDPTNYGFHVTACLFTDNEVTNNGGAITIETSQDLIKPIKIDYCSFSGNKATDANNAHGADIYYNAESKTKSSKNLLADEQSLKIIDCNFSKSSSGNAGGSIYIHDVLSKEIEVNNCVFDECSSSKSGCALDIHSEVETVLFHVVGCSFKNQQAIYFGAINGHVESCNFKDISKAVQYNYPIDTQSSNKLIFENCEFEQTTANNIKALFEITIKEHSLLEFKNNRVSISVDSVAVFDCDKEPEFTFNWNVVDNELNPQEEKYVKTPTAAKLPITCESFNFICEEPPEEPLPKDECSQKPDTFKDTDFYACKIIIKSPVVVPPKGQLILDHCNFTNFKESIAVSVSDYSGQDGIINIDVCNFVHCKKGAISLNNVETKELNISHCYFISCSEQSDVINFKSKRGIIQYCKFLNNKIDIKSSDTYGVIHYENPSTTESDDMLAIRQCYFEYNDPIGNSVFLTFKSGSKFELTYNAFKIYYYNENDEDAIPETRILKCLDGSESTDIRKYPIKGNTLHPFKPELITNNDIKYPKFGFTKPRASDCPILPDGVENTIKNVQCSNIGEGTEDPIIQSNTIVSIYHSSFNSNGNAGSLGGAVYVSISDLNVDIKIPIEIYYSAFVKCKAKCGCGIYLESTQASRLFDIHRCSFISNNDSPESTQGAGIYIKSSLSTFKISRCFFNDNKALEGGGIYFTNSEPTSSKNLLVDTYEKDIEFTLNVKDCVFISNTVNDNGGGLCIKITNAESLKPIEINSCIFLANNNNNKDGGAIYYSFDHKSTGGTSYTFLVYNSVFEENAVTQYGGSIYMVANSGGKKQIEVNHCSFEKSGSTDTDSIYIKSESTAVEFNVIDCDFVSNSIFFDALSGSIDSCRFSKYDAGKHAVKYLRDSPPDPTLDATLSIKNCDFTQAEEVKDNVVSLIFFEKSLKSIFSFTDNTILFQDNKSHVLDCTSKEIITGIDPNYWNFHNNTIDPPIYEIIKTEAAIEIPAGCGDQFSCPVETPTQTPSIEESIEESQSIEPSTEESTIEQSSSVELPPVESSSEEFPSESESLSEEPPVDGNCIGNNPCDKTYVDGDLDHINITDRNYVNLGDEQNRKTGAAIRLLNYSLVCLQTNFTGCKVSHGGGAIFIVLQKTFSMPVLLENLTFKLCRAVYGGAVYIYSDNNDNLITITSCIFEDNTANKKQAQGFEKHLYGGAACYLQTKNSDITSCSFYKNHGSGLKIFNDFDAPPKEMARILEKDQQVSLSIKDCFFEAEKDSSSSSLFFVRGNNYEVPVEVKDCTFKGELKTGTYHIDGDSLSMNKKEKSKLHIMSCKFSSNEENALSKKPMLFDSFDRNSQLFNYKEVEEVSVAHYVDQKMSRKSNNNNDLSVIVIATTGFAIVAVIAAMAIIIKKLKSKTSKDENIDSDNVIELNAAEL